MRSRIVILTGSLILVLVAVLLLGTGPEPVEDRLLPVPDAPQDAVDAVHGTSAALDKEALGEEAGRLAGSSSDHTARDAAAAEPLPSGFGRLEAGQETAYQKAPPLTEKELKSVETLVRTFFREGRGRSALNKLLKDLDQAGLEPVMAKDANPYTGKMLDIRTNEVLEGTKHYHAVYLEDEGRNKEPFPQHRSFEIRGSNDCMQRAQEIVEKELGRKLGNPVRQRADKWIEWRIGGESLWITRLGLDDIRHDPVNARTLADIGNCKAAIEPIPEEDGKGHGDGPAHLN